MVLGRHGRRARHRLAGHGNGRRRPAGDAVQGSAHAVVALCVAALAACGYTFNLRQAAPAGRHRRAAQAISPRQPRPRCSNTRAARPAEEPREMSEDQLSLRCATCWTASLQPVEAFEGFDIIDQFQPAALRYQLNHSASPWALPRAPTLPNFRGYMHRLNRT